MRTGADVVCFGYASVWGDEAVMKMVGGEETLFEGNEKVFAAQIRQALQVFLLGQRSAAASFTRAFAIRLIASMRTPT